MELIVTGHANVEIEEKRIKVVDECKFTKNGNRITIEGIGKGMSIITTNNGTICQSIGGNVFGVGNVYSNGNVCIVDGVRFTGGVCIVNGVVYQNGKVVMNETNEAKEPKKIEPTYIDIDKPCESIVLKGSGNIIIGKNSNVSSACTFSLQGSGNIKTSERTFSALNISLSGSGNIKAKDVKVEQINASLMGSGDICGFQAARGNLSLMGSGDIKISSNTPSAIMKSKMGSGSIKIRSV